jgi:putative heme-binding domain-containing protein
VKQWTVKDLESVLNVGLEGGRNFENGRNSFGAIGCFACHRFNFEGGAVGPDLTSVSGKFGPKDLLESIIEPSKEISDQYGSMDFKMKDGSLVVGRIMNLKEDTLMVNVNMLDPNAIQQLKRANIESINPSKISMMPPGLVNMLKEDDILDLLAYLLSKGDPKASERFCIAPWAISQTRSMLAAVRVSSSWMRREVSSPSDLECCDNTAVALPRLVIEWPRTSAI